MYESAIAAVGVSRPPASLYLVFTKGEGLAKPGVLLVDHPLGVAKLYADRSVESSCLERFRLVLLFAVVELIDCALDNSELEMEGVDGGW